MDVNNAISNNETTYFYGVKQRQWTYLIDFENFIGKAIGFYGKFIFIGKTRYTTTERSSTVYERISLKRSNILTMVDKAYYWKLGHNAPPKLDQQYTNFEKIIIFLYFCH